MGKLCTFFSSGNSRAFGSGGGGPSCDWASKEEGRSGDQGIEEGHWRAWDCRQQGNTKVFFKRKVATSGLFNAVQFAWNTAKACFSTTDWFYTTKSVIIMYCPFSDQMNHMSTLNVSALTNHFGQSATKCCKYIQNDLKEPKTKNFVDLESTFFPLFWISGWTGSSFEGSSDPLPEWRDPTAGENVSVFLT